MKQVLYILLAAGLTGSASLVVGNALLRAAGARLRRMEAVFLGFVLGSAVLAAVVFGLAELGLARRSVLVGAAVLLIAAGVWRGGHRLPSREAGGLGVGWSVVLWGVIAVFGLLYASVAMAPEVSVDGTTYYLADVSRWAETFGPARADGMEMLFLFAFAIGKHSAAAVVEFLFLVALAVGVAGYGERVGEGRAGAVAAVLVFASPIVGRVGTIAAPDVGVAAAVFAAFCVWGRGRRTVGGPLPVVAAQLAGVGDREHERAGGFWMVRAALAGFAVWSLAPWVVREVDKPILHLNAWYPRLPLDLAVHGERVAGLLGPVFLLLPLSLLALRWPVGRRLLIAGVVFSAVCLGAMEARALVAGLPFFALALAMVLVRWRMAAPAVVAAHLVMSWPAVMGLYTDDEAWRIEGSEWRAALRIEPEEVFLARTLPSYRVGRLLETMVPDGERVLTLAPFQQVYHTRTIVDPERSDEGRRLREVLWAAMLPERLPVGRYEVRFPERTVVRLVPEAFGGRGRWGVNEVRTFRGEREVAIVGVAGAPNSEDARFAADGNWATRWTTGRTGRDGMWLEVTVAEPVDRVVIGCAGDQCRTPQVDGGPVRAFREDPPGDLRRQAERALGEAGVRWVLASVEDRGALDLAGRAAEWGLRLRAIEDGYIVLEVPPELH